MIVITIAMAAVVGMSLGCQSTSMEEVYNTAKELNDTTFELGMDRVCGITASLAASRKLSPIAQQYRTVLCQYWTLEAASTAVKSN